VNGSSVSGCADVRRLIVGTASPRIDFVDGML
jgi:hypothetical protein